jgi:Restriction endonuclease
MDWQEFEIIVKWIYERLGRKLGVEVVGYGPTCRYTGKSGVVHQIDVLISQSNGLHTYLTAIECKCWNIKVDKDVVMKVHDINEDCRFEKSVIVSKVGFTADAIKTASNRNIQLVELKEYNLVISGGKLTKFYMHHQINQPELVAVTLTADLAVLAKYKDHALMRAADRFLLTSDKVVLELNQLINDFLNDEVLPMTHSETISSTRLFGNGTRLKSHALRGSIPVTGIQFFGFNRIYTKLDMDYFQNRMWLALKLVFEEKQLMVTLAGDIQPWDNGEPIQGIVGRRFYLKLIGNARQFSITKNFHLLHQSADPADQIPV